MAARDTLVCILELEELRKDTAATRSVIATTHRLLFLNDDEGVHSTELPTSDY